MSSEKKEKDGSVQAIDRLTVSKICSGEVVVDLATAVKELVENALQSVSQ
jgi:DNA mismatch repair protein PMS2